MPAWSCFGRGAIDAIIDAESELVRTMINRSIIVAGLEIPAHPGEANSAQPGRGGFGPAESR